MNEVDSEGLARKRSSEHLSGWASKSKTGTSKSMHDNDCTETMREQISGRECKNDILGRTISLFRGANWYPLGAPPTLFGLKFCTTFLK